MTSSPHISDNNLVIFKVGPVPCCVDSNNVLAVIEPPEHITAIPGSNAFRPGLFSYQKRTVAVYDVRTKFSLSTEQRGKIILTEIQQQLFGFWVDQIQQITLASRGRMQILPAECPKELFESLFVLNDQLVFKTNFEALSKAQVSTRAQQFIKQLVEEKLKQNEHKQQKASEQKHTAIDTSTKTAPTVPEADLNKPSKVAEKRISPSTKTTTQSTVVDNTGADSSSYPSIQKSQNAKENSLHTASKNPARNSAFTSSRQTPENTVTNKDAFTIQSQSSLQQQNEKIKSTTDTAQSQRTRTATLQTSQPSSRVTSAQQPPVTATDKTAAKEQHNKEDNQSNSAFLLIIIILLVLLPGTYLLWDFIQPPAPATKSRPVTTRIKEDKIVFDKTEQTETDKTDNAIAEDINTEDNAPDVLARFNDQQNSQPEVNAAEVGPDETTGNTLESTQQVTPETEHSARILQADNDITITLSGPAAALTSTEDETSTSPQVKTKNIDDIKTTDSDQPAHTTDIQLIAPPPVTPKKTSKRKVIHIVVKGDTLWHIAKRYIHDPFKYNELARLSKIKNPDLIYPGNRVIIIIRQQDH